MYRKTLMQLLGVVVLLTAAVVFYLKLSPASGSGDDSAYFYDLAEQKLFVAPRSSIPPIAGTKGGKEAGVRAIVISTTGDPGDKKHREIAYLEKYSPEMKSLFEETREARKAGRPAAGRIDRSVVPANTWVRRLKDTEWHSLASPEGEKIAGEWNEAGPDGRVPVVCSP